MLDCIFDYFLSERVCQNKDLISGTLVRYMFLFVLTVMDIKHEQHDPCLTYATVNQDELC